MPPDQFLCDDCLAEMSDPDQRRYRYPFINCTQCGPRYTIIRAMPYDRPNTTLSDFPLCADCHAEYTDPLDRRFHAQPLACPVCGPSLRFRAGQRTLNENEAALAAAVEAIASGKVVAVRGVGGYHLICDAGNEQAVASLRRRKHRPHKPLAVMVPMTGADGLDTAREIAELDPPVAERLADPERPIVLARLREDHGLAAGVAPGLNEVGLMLPYSPLHHLLLSELGRPVIATSGNLSGEPVLTEPEQAEARLNGIADAFLHHNRPIQRPADDPVWRFNSGRVRPIRLGARQRSAGTGTADTSGNADACRRRFPEEYRRAGLEQSRRGLAAHRRTGQPAGGRSLRPGGRRSAGALRRAAERMACDAHPDFPNSRWARDCPARACR